MTLHHVIRVQYQLCICVNEHKSYEACRSLKTAWNLQCCCSGLWCHVDSYVNTSVSTVSIFESSCPRYQHWHLPESTWHHNTGQHCHVHCHENFISHTYEVCVGTCFPRMYLWGCRPSGLVKSPMLGFTFPCLVSDDSNFGEGWQD
jgi:hypothetical protein